MNLEPKSIYKEYTDAVSLKSSIGNRGIYEQSRINERFYVGDQWYGAKCGNDRPLVRHNIIKRIGDYKMSQILSSPVSVKYSADGIPDTHKTSQKATNIKKQIANNPKFRFKDSVDCNEINTVTSALSDYRNVTARRVNFPYLCEKALKKAYVSGSAVIYTYWDGDINTGLYADDSDSTPIKGDINCEVLDIENVYFGDASLEDVQTQPFIIISSLQPVEAVKREAQTFGADEYELSLIGDGDENGKILVLTKLYKEYKINGEYTVKCLKTTEKAFIRKPYDTRLRMYPLALFSWDERSHRIYGESEITYLIPNQIAINRMITASVWASMTMGMPLMVVNGDTVADDITNDPGQIIKIFGSNEDVAGAVKYVTPPDFCDGINQNINGLIENTLEQSGANEAALGDALPNNAAAINALQNAAILPLALVKNRFYGFIGEVSRIWADFWITQYGERKIKIEDENGVWYMPFDTSRYKNLYLTVKVDVSTNSLSSNPQTLEILTELFEKGIINKRQFLKRIPDGTVPDIRGLLSELNEDGETQDDGI